MFVVQSLIMGGAERMVLEISNELISRKSADVIIVGLGSRNDYPELSKNVRFVHAEIIYELSVFGKHRIDVGQLNTIINNFKPDIIHSNCYLQEAPVREYICKSVAYFSHLHDNMPAFRKLKITELLNKRRITEYFEKKRLIKKYKECNNTFIAISNDTFDYFRNNLPGSWRQKIILLPNAIDFKKFYNNRPKNIDSSGTIKLINIGHFAPKKNQIFLLRVVKILRQKNINISLKLVGDSEAVKPIFIKEAESMGVKDCIEMPGIVNNVEDHLKQADIYVHSAIYEPFGLVLLEAMAAGLPVVCLDAGGNRDVIRNGENGFIINGEDAEKYADSILRLINDEGLYSEMSRFAIEFAKRFDIKIYVDRLLELYNSKLQ